MKCKNCKTRYESMTGGMGNPDVPRAYLKLSLIFLPFAILFSILGWPIKAYPFNCFSIFFWCAFGLSFIWCFVAASAANSTNNAYKIVCPKCKQHNKAHFWDD